MRKLRRDQSGIDPVVAPRSAPRGTAQASSHDSVSMPANPATPATTACGAAETDGSPSEARKPIAANAAIVSAAAANDRRATIPTPAPISSATATIRISSASLSFVPKSDTTKSFAPGGWWSMTQPPTVATRDCAPSSAATSSEAPRAARTATTPATASRVRVRGRGGTGASAAAALTVVVLTASSSIECATSA